MESEASNVTTDVVVRSWQYAACADNLLSNSARPVHVGYSVNQGIQPAGVV